MRFFFNLSPNPMKVALALAELDLDYEAIPVDTRRGAQFDAAFLALNPNGKVPVLVDGDATIFDSNAILLHLSERSGRFAPQPGSPERAAFLSWLMFCATGIGPYSGQAVHFRHFAPEDVPYAKTRYLFEADRHLRIVEERLANSPFLAGAEYTVADMALWGWARMVPFILGDDAWTRYPATKRWFDGVSARPAAAKVEALRAAHGGAFKAEMDDAARAVMFKHLRAA